MADEKETVILEFEVDTKDAVVSIENLTKANKELREERKKLDLSTDEGKARAQQLNAQIDKNTDVIKNNSSALEKQRLNIGNYKSALDNVIPGIGGFIDGMQGMIKSSLAFIATPIGAIIAAIGIALGSLIAYFKSSEDGQNRLNQIMLIGKSVMEQLKNFVEALGEKIYDAFNNPKQAIIDLVNLIKDNITNRIVGLIELFPKLGQSIELVFKGKWSEAGQVAVDAIAKATIGVEGITNKVVEFGKEIAKATEEGIKAGNLLAQMQASLDVSQRELIVQRAKTERDVAELREKALSQEMAQRKETVSQAIKLIQDLSDKEVQRANLVLKQAQLELKTNGDDKEAKLKVAEATAAVIKAEASRYEEAFKLQKQFEALNAKEEADAQKRLDNEIKRIQDEAAAKEQAKKDEIKLQEEVDNLFTEQDQQRTENELKEADRRWENYKRAKDAEKKLDAEALAAKKVTQSGVNAILSQTGAFMKAAFGDSKEAAIADAIVNTYKGASQAIGAYPPPIGEILAAFVVATGLANVAKIVGVQFAQGGYTGDGGKYDAAGIVHKNEFVMPSEVVNKYGVDHFNSYLDGASIANASTRAMASAQAQPAPVVYLSYKEFSEFQNKVKLKESITSAT